MRDLYLRLGLNGRCEDERQIREAISSCADEAIARDAEHVLLDDKRKRVYDHQHHLLALLGRLRAEFAIPRTPAWEALRNQDFEVLEPCRNRSTSDADIVVNTMGDVDNMGEFLDELTADPEPTPARVVTPLRPRTRRSNSFEPQAVMMLVGGFALAIVVAVILWVASSGEGKATLPSHGFILATAVEPARTNQRFELENPGPGQACVEFATMDDQDTIILSVIVREDPERVTVKLPPGRYKVYFSIGDERDWDGERFEPTLRDINSKTIVIPRDPGLRIPQGI